MKAGLAIGSLGLLGLLACAGASGSASVNGTDPASIRNAPAGAALLIFLDLELIRPDQLQAGASADLAPGITYSGAGASATYTFDTRAANEGALTGTVTVTGPVAGGLPSYTEAFNLTVTTALAGGATQTWTYTGSQQVTLNGTSAKVSLGGAAPIRAAFTDSADPSSNKSYAFTPNLALDLGDPARVTLSGGWGLAGSNGDAITVSIAAGAPILWTPGCRQYPSGGSLALKLLSRSGNDAAEAAFDQGCGKVKLNGATLGLGVN